jgi:hypothetical protein
MAGYEDRTTSAWFGVQMFPSARAEVFANVAWNQARATITNFAYDGGPYAAQLVGLDYELQSATMASYSDLEFDRVGLNGGVNYRVTNPLALNVSFDFGKFDDKQPWLFSTTGRYFQMFAGVTWLF